MLIDVTNTITFGGLTLGETDSNGVEWYWTGIDGLGAAASSSQPTQRAAADGGYASPAFLGFKTITVHGAVVAPSASQLDSALNTLNAAASIYQQSITILDSGNTYTVLGQRMDEPEWNRDNDVGAEFTIVFLLLDPRKFGTPITVSTALPSSSNGLSWPISFPISWNATQVSGLATIHNPGNTNGPVVLRINGPVQGPIITHIGSGISLVFSSSLTLNTGEFLLIDTEARTVLANGQSSRAQYVTSRGWFQLEPGDNQFGFSAVVYNSSASLAVTGTPAYL